MGTTHGRGDVQGSSAHTPTASIRSVPEGQEYSYDSKDEDNDTSDDSGTEFVDFTRSAGVEGIKRSNAGRD